MRASLSFLVSLLMSLALSVSAAPAAHFLSRETAGNMSASGNMSTQQLSASASSWWLPNVPHRGALPFGGSSSYTVWRNVMDYGAKGDGSTDDTAAINAAISAGNRCGQGCDSSTTTPALVYFPPGTYMVSKPIIQYYYTQLIGDAVNIPTIKALSNFQGIAVIDADPYLSGGANWYTNQNNFYRQIRNFVIDLRGLPMSTGTGIHWQVAQAASLQNIVFQMVQGGGSNNKQQGIFMDNGSSSFSSDLTFNGGNYGAFLGNQQFMMRNMTFNNVNTAIYMNFNWVWNFQGITINNCGVGIDMTAGGTSSQAVGSIIVQDSTFSNTPTGIKTAWTTGAAPSSAGTLVIDNSNFGSGAAVKDLNGNTILGGGQIASWVQGKKYAGSSGSKVQASQSAPSKPAVLLNGAGKIFSQSKPQYQGVPASSFVSVKSKGAKGDGSTDDTAAIQNAMNGLSSGQILFFDYGAYIISSTVTVPNNIKIVGELWPMIMAKGSAFQDANNPQPVFKVGSAGQTGSVQMSDLVFQTVGPQPGATLVEWNLGQTSQGSNAMWDVHARIGGSAGTQLQSNTCAKNPSSTSINTNCEGAYMLMHITKSGSVYLENQWLWVADHELDLSDHNQVTIYNGRGLLVESQGPVWMFGHAVEHNQLYNYNLNNAANVYIGMAQTETPYYQANPNAKSPFVAQSSIGDPTFPNCAANDPLCVKAWGMRIAGSSNVLVYGTGMYSFFDNYSQDCLNNQDCQTNMINIANSNNINMYGVSTKAAANMITNNGNSQAKDSDNRSTFCATLAMWTAS